MVANTFVKIILISVLLSGCSGIPIQIKQESISPIKKLTDDECIIYAFKTVDIEGFDISAIDGYWEQYKSMDRNYTIDGFFTYLLEGPMYPISGGNFLKGNIFPKIKSSYLHYKARGHNSEWRKYEE